VSIPQQPVPSLQQLPMVHATVFVAHVPALQ
jgi:hypothetical protein